MRYVRKTEPALSWIESREALGLRGRQILRRVMNDALAEAAEKYLAAELRGRLTEFRISDKELKAMLLESAQRNLS